MFVGRSLACGDGILDNAHPEGKLVALRNELNSGSDGRSKQNLLLALLPSNVIVRLKRQYLPQVDDIMAIIILVNSSLPSFEFF